MKEKVLLVNPNRMEPVVAPIALDYLSDSLGLAGFQVAILDLCLADDPLQAVAGHLPDSEIVAIGITVRNTDDTLPDSGDFFLPRFKAVVDGIRSVSPAPIILGGAGFSTMPEATLAYLNADFGIWGEGEYALPLLVSRLAEGKDPKDVPGLVYPSGGCFRRSPPHYLSLRDLPASPRCTVNNQLYFVKGGMGSIETKRGCPKKCIYCADPLGKGSRQRLRSPAIVVDEIETLMSRGISHLHFCDSEFNLPPGHAREVCGEIIRRGLGGRLRWYAYASPVPFTDDLATVFLQSGCAGINFGADSGSDQMLRALGRDFTVADLSRTANICHKQGLVFLYDLLLGGPGETRESLAETVTLMKHLSPSRIGTVLGIRIFPGTRLAAIAEGQGPMISNLNLRGQVDRNKDFFAPIFYVSSALGSDAAEYLGDLIGDDERFFFASKTAGHQNYNYNQNAVLVDAIQAGYRGAYWDILRRLAEN